MWVQPTCSHKRIRYRSAATVLVSPPNTGRSLKKKGPAIKEMVKLYQTLIWEECSGLVMKSQEFDVTHMRV